MREERYRRKAAGEKSGPEKGEVVPRRVKPVPYCPKRSRRLQGSSPDWSAMSSTFQPPFSRTSV
ncbi:Hypothetical protein NGAL_HAMBI2427_40920 [Neorhizobium galegae bv. orientalis]|nr:Hypothetical protein NGAL_HAMBI2427_40920 [Neorhizobium galegae bv. orientalis]